MNIKLHARLFCVLSILFAISVVSLCLVDSAAIWSRIATGLLAGSFVGLVNTITNYYHARKKYFEKYVDDISDVGYNLVKDYINIKSHRELMSTMSKNQIMAHVKNIGNVNNVRKTADEIKQRYHSLSMRFDVEEYAPLLPFCSSELKDELNKMDKLIYYSIKNLDIHYFHCHLSNIHKSDEDPSTEQDYDEEDLDDILALINEKYTDYEDTLAFFMDSFATHVASLRNKLKSVISNNNTEMLDIILDIIKFNINDAVIRDVNAERFNAFLNEDEGICSPGWGNQNIKELKNKKTKFDEVN